MLAAAIVFLIGINWGLPSRKVDQYLFGDHPVWSGQQLSELIDQPALKGDGKNSLQIGADVDANPHRIRPVTINTTDAERAEIVIRYRLYSYQPDEMITFRALASLPKTRGDPRLYQYGGLWIYPVGALLKIASVVGLAEVRSDLTFYLDKPEAFGRFYVIARLYVVAWAMVGVWAVFWLGKKISGDGMVAMFAAVLYTLLPVVINAAHEAKPHLPGAVLCLLALMAAIKYVETGTRRHALAAGAACGAAFGMVLTGALTFILLPAMCYLRWRSRPPLASSRFAHVMAHLAVSVLVGIGIYFLTNPFVAIHLLGDRTTLLSNLQNSQAMYRETMTVASALHAAQLIGEGASPVVAGVGGLCVLLLRNKIAARRLLLIAMTPMLVQFVSLANNKPAEYARFAIFVDIALMLCAVGGIVSFIRSTRRRVIAVGCLCAVTCIWSIGYVWHFGYDSMDRTSRIIAAKRLQEAQDRGAKEIAVYADPAPYCLPPVNLFDWKIVLLDPGGAPSPSTDVLLRPMDVIPKTDMPMIDWAIIYWTRPRLLPAPICWAYKPFRILLKKSLIEKEDR